MNRMIQTARHWHNKIGLYTCLLTEKGIFNQWLNNSEVSLGGGTLNSGVDVELVGSG